MDPKARLEENAAAKEHRIRLAVVWCGLGLVVLLFCLLTVWLTGHTSAPLFPFN